MKHKGQEILMAEEYLALSLKEQEKWEPVYSYIKSGQDYERLHLLWYKPYIDIPRRPAE